MTAAVQGYGKIYLSGDTVSVLNVVFILTQQNLLHKGNDELQRRKLCKQACY